MQIHEDPRMVFSWDDHGALLEIHADPCNSSRIYTNQCIYHVSLARSVIMELIKLCFPTGDLIIKTEFLENLVKISLLVRTNLAQYQETGSVNCWFNG